jgi:uncharacterized protein YlxP (DUF503 family)
VFVAAARFTLRIEGSHSLKEKRAVVRRVVDRVQQRFRIVLSEVGGPEVLDTWQRADLAFALVARARDQAEDAVASVMGFVDSLGLAERIHARHEISAYGDDWYGEPRDARAKSPADEEWIPAAWREDPS